MQRDFNNHSHQTSERKSGPQVIACTITESQSYESDFPMIKNQKLVGKKAHDYCISSILPAFISLSKALVFFSLFTFKYVLGNVLKTSLFFNMKLDLRKEYMNDCHELIFISIRSISALIR